jgi:hypothetical protein
MIKQSIFLVISIMIFSMTTYGQSQGKNTSVSNSSETLLDLHRSVFLENDSDPKEVIITIAENTVRFDLMINSSVSKGRLEIEFYSPDNKKQGNFTVGTQLNSSKRETVNGSIRKSLKEPKAGDWKIKIIPKDATGEIGIQSRTEI